MFDFSFAIGPDSGGGTLTTDDLSNNGYQVTGITGTFDGVEITGLAPTGSLLYGNDNLLFPAPTFLDVDGLGFTLADGLPDELIYGAEGGDGFFDYAQGGFGGPLGTFEATQVVPEPATAGLFLTALAGLGLLRRRRR